MRCNIDDLEIENIILEKCSQLFPEYLIFRENPNWNEEIFQIIDWIKNQYESIEFEEDEEPDNYIEDITEDALREIDDDWALENQSAIMSPERHYNLYMFPTIQQNFKIYISCCEIKEIKNINEILDQQFTYCISKVIKKFVKNDFKEKYEYIKNIHAIENEFIDQATEYWEDMERREGRPFLEMLLPHEHINPLMIEL